VDDPRLVVELDEPCEAINTSEFVAELQVSFGVEVAK
jgi:hypothetical protein